MGTMVANHREMMGPTQQHRSLHSIVRRDVSLVLDEHALAHSRKRPKRHYLGRYPKRQVWIIGIGVAVMLDEEFLGPLYLLMKSRDPVGVLLS